MKMNIIKRNQINQILSGVYQYPLTVVEAPFGFGKTVAVKSFLATKRMKSLWITFEGEEKQENYWEKFTSGLHKLEINNAEEIAKLSYPQDLQSREKLMTQIRKIKLKEKLIIVFDNYHSVNSIKFAELIIRFTEENMNNISVIIITRVKPVMRLDEMVSKQLCQIISQSALRFSGEEAREYCLSVDEHISDIEISRLTDYSDGWISMLHMLLCGLKEGSPIGLSIGIIDYIDQTLFQLYSSEIQNFIIKLSVLDYFTEELALYITENEKTDQFIKILQRENAFIYYDNVNKRYCFYHVLLDFLRMKQNITKEERNMIYHNVGEWYLERKNFLIAYEAFFQAGEHERILIHLSSQPDIQIHLFKLNNYMEMLHGIPRKLFDRYPIAQLKFILFGIIKNKKMAMECNKQLERLEKLYLDREDLTSEYKNRITAEISLTRSFLAFNRNEDMMAGIDCIPKLLNEDSSILFNGDYEILLEAPLLLYNYFHQAGSFQRIAQMAVEKFDVFSKYMNGFSYGADYLAMAEYELETGKWSDAEQNSLKAIYKAKMKNQYNIMMSGNFCLMRLYIFQGKIKEALETLEKLENETLALKYINYNTMLEIFKGYLYGCLGQPDKIPQWLREGEIATDRLFRQGIALSITVHCKAVALSGDYTKLEILCESYPECLSFYSNQMGNLYNSIFEAIAKYQLYGMDAGVRALQKALEMGEADGIILPFIENADGIIDMLKTITQKVKSRFSFKIFRYSKYYLENLRELQKPDILLTKRETEILILAADGLNRGEIAEKLVVSEGTVKTHLQNIYQKLGVSGKSAAVKRAYVMGLIT
jgi:ATP-dependent transcriptional regulator